MKNYFLSILLFISQIICVFSQNIPSERITDWKNPGSLQEFISQNIVSLSSFGADTSGITPSDNALQQAIIALNGPGEIFIHKGTYLFLQSINLPDSIIIQGETDTLTHASLVNFKLSPGNNSNGINIIGSETNTNYTITYPLIQGQQKLYVSQPNLFNIGDFIDLKANDDSLLVNNSWAYHSTGQIFQITQIYGDSLLLNKPFRRSYSGINLPVIYKLLPRKQVHIKCINIERLDSVSSQAANIYYYCATDCSIKGIKSFMCNFAHIDIRNSIRISVENSFFKDAHSYGSGGKGYGVIVESQSGDCFIHQNNFEHLRHSMILQSGSNGNVFAYNYSKNPYWTETSLPSYSAGDIVLHGNYVYMNLFEGNVVQNIVIDDSHGINGPYNTFYRNRAELYGIFMNAAPATNFQNFIGNQIINTTSFVLGLYYLQGTEHFQYGNIVKGNVLPTGTIEPEDTSMFNYTFHSFYRSLSAIPPITNSNWLSTTPLTEANYRYQISDKKAICDEITYISHLNINSNKINNDEITVYPNPFTNEISIENISKNEDYLIKIYNSLGQNIYSGVLNSDKKTINTSELNSGIYFLYIQGKEKFIIKLLKY